MNLEISKLKGHLTDHLMSFEKVGNIIGVAFNKPEIKKTYNQLYNYHDTLLYYERIIKASFKQMNWTIVLLKISL